MGQRVSGKFWSGMTNIGSHGATIKQAKGQKPAILGHTLFAFLRPPVLPVAPLFIGEVRSMLGFLHL